MLLKPGKIVVFSCLGVELIIYLCYDIFRILKKAREQNYA